MKLIGGKECAIIAIRMDFIQYYESDSSEKTAQIRDVILKAVKKLKSRCDLHYAQFEHDLLTIPLHNHTS